MRGLVAVAMLAVLAVLAGCGGKDDAAGPVAPVAEKPAAAVENAATAVPAPVPDTGTGGGAAPALQLTCGAPFNPEATAATLAAAFGRENVIPETVDRPEGEKLNVTAIYPRDPAKRIEVSFRNEEERTGLASVTVRSQTSQWTGPGGVRMGAGVEEVEKANGGPVQMSGFDWDYGGYVTGWKGGKLEHPAPDCRTTLQFGHKADKTPASVLGEGSHLSTEKGIRDAKPAVTLFGISWKDVR